MITQSDGFHPERLKDYVRHLYNAFGPSRLMFGSDWPVALLGGTYDEVVDLFHSVLPEGLNNHELEQIRRENAIRCYRLKDHLC
jgi:L-fuconolactonase